MSHRRAKKIRKQLFHDDVVIHGPHRVVRGQYRACSGRRIYQKLKQDAA